MTKTPSSFKQFLDDFQTEINYEFLDDQKKLSFKVVKTELKTSKKE